MNFTGTLDNVYYYTEFEVTGETMYTENNTVLTGAVSSSNFTFERNYEDATATANVQTATDGNSFILEGTGYILTGRTGGSGSDSKWNLWMPYPPTEAEKDAAVAGILQAVNSIKGATVKQEDVAWTTQEELETTGVTITYLENGQVQLDFDASCQWNQFYFGEFLFTGMDVTGTLTNVMATGNLSITKNVERNGETDNSGTTPFTFEIEVPTASGPYTVVYSKTDTDRPTNVSFTTSGGGTTPKAQIQVYPGETVTINGLPSGVTATVKETGYDGYAPSWKVGEEAQTANYASTTITAGQTIAVTCTNTTGAVLPSTGGMGVVPYFTLGSLMTIGGGLLLIRRRWKGGHAAR